MIRSVLSASVMCADPLNLMRDLEILKDEGVEYLHLDIMDGHFVPNMMISPEVARAIRRGSDLPLDIHMMCEKPEMMLDWFDFGPGDIVSIHFESTPHAHRALGQIAARGATPALALNPATPLSSVEDVLPDIGMLLLMTVNPGFAAQKLIPATLDKIARARRMLDEWGYSHVPIEVDGNCSFENIPRMEEKGASVFVVGSSSLFSKELGVREGARRTRGLLKY